MTVHLVIDEDVKNLFMSHTVYSWQLPKAIVELIVEMAANRTNQRHP